ncbi:MAG: hypothetical protein N2D54_05845, partial [Chloroflexota bacterium]
NTVNFEQTIRYWGRIVKDVDFNPAYTRPIFTLRETTNKIKTSILTDYATYNAFYDYENVFIYQRLPWFLLQGDERFFPDNREVLDRLLQTKIEYLAISKTSEKTLSPLLKELKISTIVIDETENFVTYKIITAP